ncbi:MAG: BlaR1 family beta-lactam sensor/signal transducer, partial [Lachnospiraceae bacterium]|nr:BlaR1 family beta-lactam sensor/signal transducer [Lachnospiraceae bacterium]
MSDFMIRFFICNIFICALIGILLAVKYLFKNCLTSRMQYHLWFVLLVLLAVPFIPVRPIGHLHFFSWLNGFTSTSAENAGAVIDAASQNSSTASILQNDFAISVSRET